MERATSSPIFYYVEHPQKLEIVLSTNGELFGDLASVEYLRFPKDEKRKRLARLS